MTIITSDEWEEVKDIKELAKIQTVEEMLPKPHLDNQIALWGNAYIWEDHYKIIEECLRLDCTVEEACMTAGISVQSYYKHRDKYPEFARRMELAKQFPKMMARAAVQRRIRQWDSKTALRYLELRDKKRYNADPNIKEWWEEETEDNAQVVQFISVPSEEWNEKNSQTSTKQKSAWASSASSWERQTPRENEEQALKNLDLLNFSNG